MSKITIHISVVPGNAFLMPCSIIRYMDMAVLGNLIVSGLVHQDYRPTSIVTVNSHYEGLMNQVTNLTGRALPI